MSNSDVKIELFNEVTPEVVEGFKLYADLTSRSFDAESWLYWFKENPYGEGLHSVAMNHGKVIGIYSLIPTEMRLAGNTLIGAKGEFLTVAPDFRNSSVKGSGKLIAFDLIDTLHHRAIKQGIEVIAIVAYGRIITMHKLLGAKIFEFPGRFYLTIFDSSESMDYKKKVAFYGGVFSIPRTWFSIKTFVNKSRNHKFKQLDYLDSDCFSKFQEKNRLVHTSPKMMNFRFPKERYLKYLTHDKDESNCLIFTKPTYKSHVNLKDWSSLDIQKSEFDSVFRDLFEQCKKNKVESMSFIIPDQAEMSYSFHRIGFLSQKYIHKFGIYAPDSLINEINNYPWDITDAHVGYI